jgi:NAD dependent epimerase/dehydratase family enzyme
MQQQTTLSGVFNTAAPNPVDNKTLMALLRKQLKMPIGLPTPTWLLKMGAVIIKTETELILKSRWVIPEKLLQNGFAFKYPNLQQALKNSIEN